MNTVPPTAYGRRGAILIFHPTARPSFLWALAPQIASLRKEDKEKKKKMLIPKCTLSFSHKSDLSWKKRPKLKSNK